MKRLKKGMIEAGGALMNTTLSKAKGVTVDINQVADYVCFRLNDAGSPPSQLKLHKLLYYIQAWNLALYDEPLLDEKFQAWIHGPVSRTIYDRFKNTKNMFSSITEEDIHDYAKLPQSTIYHIDEVLEAYGDFSGTQLEELTHQEDPWINARKGLNRFDRAERIISEEDMKNYYKSRLN
jgi:uncharacterized phage-associated protein